MDKYTLKYKIYIQSFNKYWYKIIAVIIVIILIITVNTKSFRFLMKQKNMEPCLS